VELHDILQVKDTVIKCVLGHRVHRWQPCFSLELVVHHVGTQTVVLGGNTGIGKAQCVVGWAVHCTAGKAYRARISTLLYLGYM